MNLSIVVITMNRALQLQKALLSCLACKLPKLTEFVIVDNASVDNTKEVVNTFITQFPEYVWKYDFQNNNLGVGGGRNRGFFLSSSKFVYFLDDDAVISDSSTDSFFLDALALFDADDRVATITTRIYDEMLGYDRGVVKSSIESLDHVPNILMYLGGSHFIRKSYFEDPLYLDIKYGMEELLPSLYAIDRGYRNCYLDHLILIHQPQINKWVANSEQFRQVVINEIGIKLETKKKIYPGVFLPVLYLFSFLRCIKSFRFKISTFGCILKVANNVKSDKKHDKISLKTVFKLIREFGVAATF